jgi:amino acid transporter
MPAGGHGAGVRLGLHLHLRRAGRALAWIVGWALVLEYAVGAGAVAVGWSGYMNGLLSSAGVGLPEYLKVGPQGGGMFNLLACVISLAITGLLVLGTSKSAGSTRCWYRSRSSR